MAKKVSIGSKVVMVDMYENPKNPARVIAQRFKVHRTTVSRILRCEIPEDKYKMLKRQKYQQAARAKINRNKNLVA